MARHFFHIRDDMHHSEAVKTAGEFLKDRRRHLRKHEPAAASRLLVALDGEQSHVHDYVG